MEDLGIYTNIVKTNERVSEKDKHFLYEATCKICGQRIKRRLYDLKHFNAVCQHNSINGIYGIKGTKNSKNILLDSDYNKRVYDLWRHMLLRTTVDYQNKFPTYLGTTVCDEWLDFSVFYEDIKELENYQYWKEHYGERVMIDKDKYGNGSKLYSKETCCFLTHADSNREVFSRYPELINAEAFQENRKRMKEVKGRKVIATNLETGEKKTFLSLKECAKFLNTNSGNVYMCLSNRYCAKTLKGWSLEEILD